MKKYEAIYLPSSENFDNPSKKGFDSEEEAWNYIYTQLCDECKKLYDTHGLSMNACAAEWMVDEEE